ncbi:hypothetical protein NDU88_005243 [Pleurodeles waltl]|uniref:Uncharacterized protein n=1 Tax=Pleurodeles waltl TaxID=8319 RepID=A0AAV7RKE9_PLEWA|nr:hypothetical protein NDU88_005243 [Pleurodeles waltl]
METGGRQQVTVVRGAGHALLQAAPGRAASAGVRGGCGPPLSYGDTGGEDRALQAGGAGRRLRSLSFCSSGAASWLTLLRLLLTVPIPVHTGGVLASGDQI